MEIATAKKAKKAPKPTFKMDIFDVILASYAVDVARRHTPFPETEKELAELHTRLEAWYIEHKAK